MNKEDLRVSVQTPWCRTGGEWRDAVTKGVTKATGSALHEVLSLLRGLDVVSAGGFGVTKAVGMFDVLA